MFGFIYVDKSRDVLLDGGEEIFATHRIEEKPILNWSATIHEIREENQQLFGRFREREAIRSSARLAKVNEFGDWEAILFVNYRSDIEFSEQLKSDIRALLKEMVDDAHSLRVELEAADAKWRSEATRIVSPAQTVANTNFYSLDKPDFYFNQIIEAALRVLNIPEGTGLGVIHLYNAELERLELRGSFGPIQYLEKAENHLVKNGGGVVSWVALTKRSLLIQDLAKSEFRRIHVWLNEDTKSELAVPLEAGGELIGTMCLECTEANKFLPHHVRSLWYAANEAAIAYQLHQLASMNRKLLTLCWEATTVEGAHISLNDLALLAKDYLRASSCDITRYNSETKKFDSGGASYGDFIPQVRPKGWTEFIHRFKLPVWISNIEGSTQCSVHCWEIDQWVSEAVRDEYPGDINPSAIVGGVRNALGIPIIVRDECVGVAWVKYKRQRAEFPGSGLMSLALGFAAEAGLVLDSIQRQEVDLKEKSKIDFVAEQVFSAIKERWQLDNSDILEAHVISDPLHSKLGGDFYAGKIIDKNTVGILLVDGQGHGVGGSLHMLPFMTAFESIYQSYSTAHVISQLAKTAEALGVRGSAIYCIFSRIGNKTWLSVTSAGHESLMIFKREGRDRWSLNYVPPFDIQVPMFGHPLSEPFMDYRIELSAGDIIVGYTDGVADQLKDFNATLLGAFVTHLLGENKTQEPRHIAEAIIEESREKHSYSFDDDTTVFVARVR